MQVLLTEKRIIGAVLALSLLIPVSLGIMVALRPHFPAFQFISGQLEGVADQIGLQQTFLLFWAIAMLCVVLGMGMLSVMLFDAGARMLAAVGVIALLIVGSLWVVEIGFHLSVTRWAALETARTGATPEIYEPLRQWVSVSNQQLYLTLGMFAMAAYGRAILITGLLPAPIGWFAIVWGALWLLMILVTHTTIPAILFVIPGVVGFIMLLGQ